MKLYLAVLIVFTSPVLVLGIMFLLALFSALFPPRPFINEHWNDIVITDGKRNALTSLKLMHVFFDETPGGTETYGWNNTTFLYKTAAGYFSYEAKQRHISELPIPPNSSVLVNLARGEIKRCDNAAFEELTTFPWVKGWKYDCFQVKQGGILVRTSPFYPKQSPNISNLSLEIASTRIPILGRWCLRGPPMISPDGLYIALFATKLNPYECINNFADIHILELRSSLDAESNW